MQTMGNSTMVSPTPVGVYSIGPMYFVLIKIPTELTTSFVFISSDKTNWLDKTNTKLITTLKTIIFVVNLLNVIIAIASLSAYKIKAYSLKTLII